MWSLRLWFVKGTIACYSHLLVKINTMRIPPTLTFVFVHLLLAVEDVEAARDVNVEITWFDHLLDTLLRTVTVTVHSRLTFQLSSALQAPSHPQARSFWKFLNVISDLLVSDLSVSSLPLSRILHLPVCEISRLWVQHPAHDFAVYTSHFTDLAILN